jgi:hypothetical protein
MLRTLPTLANNLPSMAMIENIPLRVLHFNKHWSIKP